MPPSPLSDALIGTQLGGYRIDALIGAGGMSRVYRGFQLSLQRAVAIKVLAPGLASDTSYRQRFLHESHLAASIEHPNILPIYDAGDSAGYLYLAMRLVDGTDLRRLLEREGALVPTRALSLMTQAALALDAAHTRGLVHRDIKPANLLLEGEHLFLTDFGIAKVAGEQAGLTRIGMFVGTIDYASPEQIRQEPLDGRSDLYSLACVFYQCLTGAAPFDRPTEHATVQAHLTAPPPSLREQKPELPAALDAVLATALAKDRESRYRSGRYFADAARSALEGRAEPVPARATVIAPLAQRETVVSTAATTASPAPLSEQPSDRVPQNRTPALFAAVAIAAVIIGGLLYSRMFVASTSGSTTVLGAVGSTPAPPSPAKTVTPTPAPTHPYAVSLRPEQVIMPPTEFPLAGYSVTRDQADPPYGWQRLFGSTGSDYWWIDVYVYVYPSYMLGSDRIAAAKCNDFSFSATNGDRLLSQTEISAVVVGDGAKACLQHFAGTTADMTEYITATRNVEVIVMADPRYATNAQALNLVVQIARQQLGIIGQVAPP